MLIDYFKLEKTSFKHHNPLGLIVNINKLTQDLMVTLHDSYFMTVFVDRIQLYHTQRKNLQSVGF